MVRPVLRGRRRHLLLAFLGAMIHLASLLAVPLVSQRALDDMVGGSTRRLPLLAGILVGLGVIRAVSGGLRKYQASKLMAGAGVDIRSRVYEHLQQLSFSFHDRVGSGQLMARASSDVTALEMAVSMAPFVLQSVLLGAGGAVILMTIHVPLALVVIATFAAVGTVAIRTARPMPPLSRTLQDRIGHFTAYVEQQVQGIRIVKGHGSEPRHRREGETLAGAIRESGTDLARRRSRFLATFLLTPSSGSLAVLGFGAWLGARGALTPGELFAFLQYLALLMNPVQVGAQMAMILPQAVAAAARIGEVLAAEPDVTDPVRPRLLPDGGGHIRFEGIRFGYDPDRPVLADVSLDVAPGSAVALVGASGAGKSTLALLVPRFYEPQAGRVLLDGVDVNDLRLQDLRGAVAMVFEDTVVFSGTIRQNIALGRPTADDAEVLRAATLAQVDEFVRHLPDGYETVVGEHGASLSGGQRQRLAIARAILRNPRVLILDDAMSAVDPSTDEAIRAGLGEVMRDRTTLIVAHRLETIALADVVVLLDGGGVVATGTHEALCSHPAYRTALALDAPTVDLTSVPLPPSSPRPIAAEAPTPGASRECA